MVCESCIHLCSLKKEIIHILKCQNIKKKLDILKYMRWYRDGDRIGLEILMNLYFLIRLNAKKKKKSGFGTLSPFMSLSGCTRGCAPRWHLNGRTNFIQIRHSQVYSLHVGFWLNLNMQLQL